MQLMVLNPAQEYRGFKLEPYAGTQIGHRDPTVTHGARPRLVHARRKISAWRVTDPEGYVRLFDTLEKAKAWIDASGWVQNPGGSVASRFGPGQRWQLKPKMAQAYGLDPERIFTIERLEFYGQRATPGIVVKELPAPENVFNPSDLGRRVNPGRRAEAEFATLHSVGLSEYGTGRVKGQAVKVGRETLYLARMTMISGEAGDWTVTDPVSGAAVVQSASRAGALRKLKEVVGRYGQDRFLDELDRRRAEVFARVARPNPDGGRSMEMREYRTAIRVRRQGEGYRIDERVTPAGEYITWPGFYATKAGAEAAAERGARRGNPGGYDPQGGDTRVIFRRWIGSPGTVIAIFPDIAADMQGNIQSYEHLGQHGAADYRTVMQRTAPAVLGDSDVIALRLELEGRGYTNLLPVSGPRVPLRRYQARRGNPGMGVHKEMFDRWAKYIRLFLAERNVRVEEIVKPVTAWNIAHHLDIPREANHVGLKDAHIETALRRILPYAFPPRGARRGNPEGGYYELKPGDVGRRYIAAFGRRWPVVDFIGQVLPGDIGKRVYRRGDILQVENDEQRARRLGARRGNPGAPWHSRRRDEYRRMARETLNEGNRHYYTGHADAHEESVSGCEFLDEAQRGARRRGKPRRGNPGPGRGAAQGFQMFHDADPDRAYKVTVPDSFPAKLYMIGKLHKLILDSGATLSGGVLAAGGGDRMYILGARGGTAGGRAVQIEYIPPKSSRKAGAVYFHKFTRPPQVRRVGTGGNYTVAGKGVKLTPRGIIG